MTDLDIALRGPVAASAGRFLDELWKWVHNAPSSQAWIAVGASDKPADWSLYKNLAPANAGNLEVISVGSLGYGIQVRDETSHYVLPPALRVEQAAYRLHTKLVCVDDTAFYVGSRNVYPDTTQDHGFFIENSAAVAQLNHEFLDKQWFFSRNAAICDYQW